MEKMKVFDLVCCEKNSYNLWDNLGEIQLA
jgi:hypothetical protein